MNEKHGFFQKLGKALNGKGFYMVLLLCLMLLGASGFYLYRTVTAPSAPEQTASGQAEVIVTSPLPEESTTTAQDSSEVQVTSEPAPEVQTAAPAEDSAPSEDIPTDEGTDEAAAAPVDEEAEPASAPVLYWPAGGEVVSAFSSSELTYNAAMGDWRTHNGIDIAAGLGTDVCAAATRTPHQPSIFQPVSRLTNTDARTAEVLATSLRLSVAVTRMAAESIFFP